MVISIKDERIKLLSSSAITHLTNFSGEKQFMSKIDIPQNNNIVSILSNNGEVYRFPNKCDHIIPEEIIDIVKKADLYLSGKSDKKVLIGCRCANLLDYKEHILGKSEEEIISFLDKNKNSCLCSSSKNDFIMELKNTKTKYSSGKYFKGQVTFNVYSKETGKIHGIKLMGNGTMKLSNWKEEEPEKVKELFSIVIDFINEYETNTLNEVKMEKKISYSIENHYFLILESIISKLVERSIIVSKNHVKKGITFYLTRENKNIICNINSKGIITVRPVCSSDEARGIFQEILNIIGDSYINRNDLITIEEEQSDNESIYEDQEEKIKYIYQL